jgi:hypothetical protein
MPLASFSLSLSHLLIQKEHEIIHRMFSGKGTGNTWEE